MNEALSLKAQVLQMGQMVAERAVTLVPSLLGALLLLLVGWLLARLLRAFSHRLLQWSDSALERLLGPAARRASASGVRPVCSAASCSGP